MSLFPQPAIIGASEYSKGYSLEDSLRFRSSASAYLSRTPTSTGNRKTWTWSAWVKRGNLTTSFGKIWAAGVDNTGAGTNIANSLFFHATEDRLEWSLYGGGFIATVAKFRDPSAWYHIVLSIDTTQSTASDRIKIYVNGVQQTLSGTYWMSLNTDYAVNNTTNHTIGKRPDEGSSNFDGYITEVNFIDGQALDPSYFGETDVVTGVWKPKKYTGSYGTNGFYLPMTPTSQAEGFNTVLYTGTGATQSITGAGFAPDLIWFKNRGGANNHALYDSVRGRALSLISNATNSDITSSAGNDLASFDSDGFTVGPVQNHTSVNGSGQNIVAWCWDAGSGSPVSNTDGTITSTVKANQAKGFSIVTWTGSGVSGQSVGHGLSSAPELIINKARGTSDDQGWFVYTAATGNGNKLYLNTAAGVAGTGVWQNTTPTSSVFYIHNGNLANNYSGTGMVGYCFHSVAGYSKIGSYTGNGSSTGPVITTGFKPAWILIRGTDPGGRMWVIRDKVRDPNNPTKKDLYPNSSAAEYAGGDDYDLLDNGFQPKTTGGTFNASGETYIYMAIADTRNTAFNNDASGNQNNWTPNNINSNASGQSTYDLMKDVPTLTDADAGNFCTLNPLDRTDSNTSVTNGNLTAQGYLYGGSNYRSVKGTMYQTEKFYFEATISNTGSSSDWYGQIGIANSSFTCPLGTRVGGNVNSWAFIIRGGSSDVAKLHNNSATQLAAGLPSAGDVIMVACDPANGKVWFGRNGTWYASGDPASGTNAAYTNVSSSVTAAAGMYYNLDIWNINAGQRPFTYTPPSGYKALNTYNLPTPTIADGGDYFNALAYSGTGTSRTQTGVGFQPDFVWIKQRNSTGYHNLFDVIRGAGYNLSSNSTDPDANIGHLTSFASDGFGLDTNSDVNASGSSYISWNWKANSSGVSNTDGSTTSTVSANTSSGFSVATYTGTGSAATIGHGLGIAPSMLIVKRRSNASTWAVYHASLGAGKKLELNGTSGQITNAQFFPSTPTSSVFSLGTEYDVNGSGGTFVCYAFAPIAGYSAFGSYTGNGSADGPFVYTGFRPAFVMMKRTDTAGGSWPMIDKSRNGFNIQNYDLYANLTQVEATSVVADLTSNGFKLRGTSSEWNGSGNTYIYMAFAENPFKYSLAR